MKTGTILLVMMLALSLACAAADESVDAAAETTAKATKVALDANEMPIAEALASVGEQAGVQIVCDTGVEGTVTGTFNSIELESLLDLVAKSNDLKWQKVYLPSDTEEKPTLAQVKARVQAVSALTGGTIVVYDPATGKQKVFVEQDSETPSVDPEKLGMSSVYLVSLPKSTVEQQSTTASDVAVRVQKLQSERMSLLTQLSSAERVGVYQQEMVHMMLLAPDMRQQLVMDQILARHNLDEQTRNDYREVMHDAYHLMRDQGLITRDWRGGRRGS